MAAKKKTKTDPIQVWRITAKREHYDEIPFDWPRVFIEVNTKLVRRPVPNAVLPKPISVEVLGPASELRRLRRQLSAHFICTVVSTDKP